MKIKMLFIILFLSTATWAYTPQEILQQLHHTTKHAVILPNRSGNKNSSTFNWQRLPFPQINGKFNVLVMKSTDTVIFVYHPYSSNRSIYKSQDRGHHWNIISTPNVQHIHHLISLDATHLLLAGDNHIYLSTDQGEHWLLTATIDQSCDTLYAPTPHLVLLTTNSNNDNPRLYRSTDGGHTFTPTGLGIADGHAFVALGGNENALLAGTDSLYISTDQGLLWKQPTIQWFDKLLSFVAINHQADIFLTANNHLYKTDMTGQIWEVLSNDMGSIEILKIDSNDKLYAVGQQEEDFSLYRSSNRGQTWDVLHHFNHVRDLNILNNNIILVNTDEGLLLSDESQLHYTTLPSLPDANATNEHIAALDNEHFFATALPYAGPLYASDNAGATWTIKRNTAVLDIATFNQQIIVLEYDGDNQQIVASNDFGNTWQRIFHIDNNYCHSLSSQHHSLTIHCNKESYFTQDLLQWVPLRVNKKNPTLTSYFSGYAIYVTDGNSIQRSADNGSHWTYLLNNINQHQMYMSGYNDELLIIAINNAGIIKMTNEGKNWELINNGLSNFDFTSLIVIDPTHYLASTTQGIFYTENGGASWSMENSGLTNSTILSLSLYKTTLLAGTDSSGIFTTYYQ